MEPDRPPVRHQVAIAGRVVDASKRPLAGADVRLVEMPAAARREIELKGLRYGHRWKAMAERPDRARAAHDGLFYFLDLPNGKYTVAASLAGFGKRYGEARANATVSRDGSGNIKFKFVTISVQATKLEGSVTIDGERTGILLAEIRVNGSGERAFSDADGRYVITGLEPGKRTVVATAESFVAVSKQVVIEQAGEVATVNFALARTRTEGGPAHGTR